MTDGSRDPGPEPSRRASELRVAATDAPVRRPPGAPAEGTLGPAVIASRYRLERELGRGGAAIVWLAHDGVEDRSVAVKILRAEIADTVASDRFLEEIRIVTAFEHPRLLPILGSGEWDGLLYYVTPYVEGGSLRARLERERQLPIAEALAIVRDVADALEYTHQRGVIHRDVKPVRADLLTSYVLAIWPRPPAGASFASPSQRSRPCRVPLPRPQLRRAAVQKPQYTRPYLSRRTTTFRRHGGVR